MKKIFLIYIIAIISLTINISCKKDEKRDNKEYLMSGKWFYEYETYFGTNTNNSCFNENHYFEFRKDGSVVASTLGEGTYILSDDLKTFTLHLNKNLKQEFPNWNGTINQLRDNYLRLTVKAIRNIDSNTAYEITMAQKKTQPDCYKK